MNAAQRERVGDEARPPPSLAIEYSAVRRQLVGCIPHPDWKSHKPREGQLRHTAAIVAADVRITHSIRAYKVRLWKAAGATRNDAAAHYQTNWALSKGSPRAGAGENPIFHFSSDRMKNTNVDF